MGLFRALKINAKRALSGSWGRAIGIMLIAAIPGVLLNLLEYGIREVTGISEFVNRSGTGNAFRAAANIAPASIAITLLVSLLVFFIMIPLQQGIVRWYYRLTAGEREGVTGIFHYFETAAGYFRALWLNFLIALRICLWGALLTVPLVLLFGLLAVAGGAGRATHAFALLLILVWTVIVTVVLVIIGLRYFLAPYLLAEHPDYKARRAIREGVRLARGQKGSIFLFGLSFILWYLPTLLALLLVFIIPFSDPFYLFQIAGLLILLLLTQLGLCFYLTPYQNAAFAMYARYLIQTGESSGPDSYADSTREYKPEIDRYMEAQSVWVPQQEPSAPEPPADDPAESAGPEAP